MLLTAGNAYAAKSYDELSATGVPVFAGFNGYLTWAEMKKLVTSMGVAVRREHGRLRLRVEAVLRHRRLRVGEEARAERVVGLQGVEAAVERVGLRRRKPVVHLVHRRHSTTALPWCHDGS